VDGISDLAVPVFAPRSELKVGQWAIAAGIGFGGQRPSLSAGIISATSRISGKAVQTDANLSPANYGGPLVDLDGRIIGVCVPLSPEASETAGAQWYDSGIGFAVPLDGLDKIVQSLKEGKTLQRPFLGVEIEPPDESTTAEPTAGARVKSVVDGSPAAKAGIQPADRILAIDGAEVLDGAHLVTVIGRSLAGDTVTIQIERAGNRQNVAARLVAPQDPSAADVPTAPAKPAIPRPPPP
jgi:serine protease Do